MAERRMFTTQVVDSDEFLELPLTAQALYFHLGMRADDDGFVHKPKAVLRTVLASGEDLDRLVERGFVLLLDGIAVIRHWRQANVLKNDRLRPLQFPDLAGRIYLREDKSYTDQPQPGLPSLRQVREAYLAERLQRRDKRAKAENGGSKNPGSTLENFGSTLENFGTRREEKGREQNRTEEKGNEENRTQVKAAEAEEEMHTLGGTLGKGVLLLTDRQIGDLMEKMGNEAFDYYADKLSSYIVQTGRKVRSHYRTILQWWQEDRQVKEGDAYAL